MGLAGIIQKATQTAFKAIGDIPITCVYTSKQTSTYNAIAGIGTSYDLEYSDIDFVFEDYTAQEITLSGGTILRTDQKASIPQLNLEPTPVIKDIITDTSDNIWTIENIKTDPARALWVFQARQNA